MPYSAIAEHLHLSREAKHAAAGLDLAALAALPEGAPLCDTAGNRQCPGCGRLYSAVTIAAR